MGVVHHIFDARNRGTLLLHLLHRTIHIFLRYPQIVVAGTSERCCFRSGQTELLVLVLDATVISRRLIQMLLRSLELRLHVQQLSVLARQRR